MGKVIGHLNPKLLGDPFWHVSLACYALHRCWQGFHTGSGWFDHYWNDLWMLPCALPLVLFLYQILGLRLCGAVPSGSEIFWHGMLLSLMAEVAGPLLFEHAVGDPWDILAYAMGGGMLYCRWHIRELTSSSIAIRF